MDGPPAQPCKPLKWWGRNNAGSRAQFARHPQVDAVRDRLSERFDTCKGITARFGFHAD